MRDHIEPREIATRAAHLRELIVEPRVDVYAHVGRAVERTRSRSRAAAAFGRDSSVAVKVEEGLLKADASTAELGLPRFVEAGERGAGFGGIGPHIANLLFGEVAALRLLRGSTLVRAAKHGDVLAFCDVEHGKRLVG